MATTRNNVRYDLSDRLIHFFRSINPSDDDTPVLPEDWGFASMENVEAPLSPFFLMRNAVRLGRLWATWSVRRGQRTIYGPDPAVCFTEMPIAAFVEAGLARATRGEAMSPYGLVFPKTAMFILGARPVIYGLSCRVSTSIDGTGARMIASTQLPPCEQYRYVTYNPAASMPIDWTHEREWRWPLRDGPSIDPDDLPPDVEDLHGLKLDVRGLDCLGAIVKTGRQAEQLVYDILTKIDRGDIGKGHYEFVLALESVPKVSDLRDQVALSEAIDDARIDLSSFFTIKEARATKLATLFSQLVADVEATAATAEPGEPGCCWLWITGNSHEMTRALLKGGRARVTKAGKYIVDLDEFDASRGLAQREDMTETLAKRLETEFGVHATHLSVLNSSDPDAIPFYNGDELDDRLFYNHSHDNDDY
jgi:hypothetical protein